MELIHIKLQEFKRFSRLDVSFTPGLNVVQGPNEAGKSTLHEAILLGLLDRPTGKQSEQRHQSWGQDDCSNIEITYRLPGGDLYKIRKNYDKREFEVIGPNGRDNSRSGLESAIESALGTTSEKLFSSTACIRQDEMMGIDSGGGEISRQLQHIAMGGVSDVDEVIRRLADKVAEFERGWKTNAPRNPGPIKQLKEKIAEIEGQIQSYSHEVERREQAKEKLHEQRERVEAIGWELKPLQELHGAHIQRLELMQSLEGHRRREEELEEKIEKVESAVTRKQQIQKRLENLGQIDWVDGSKERELQRANEDVKARLAEVADREVYVSECERQMERESRPIYGRFWAPVALLILGAMLGSSGALSPQYLDPNLGLPLRIIGGSLALLGLLWSVVLVTMDIRKRKNLRTHLQEAQERYEKGLDASGAAKDYLDALLQRYDCDSWEAFEEKLEKAHSLQAELKLVETTLEVLLDKGQTPFQLAERRKEISRARRDLQEELEKLEHIPRLSSIEFQKVVSSIERLETERKQCQDQILKLSALSQVDGATVEDLNCLKERESTLQDQLKVALDRLVVFQLTLGGLRQVRDQVMREAQHELAPRLGRYLERLTQGRYARASVDENLQIEVYLNSTLDQSVGVEVLSGGTRDQVYFSARLALCDMLFGKAQPPLLLDDPFVTFDSERKEAALKLCKELSTDRQILLFTCHEGYAHYADNVITL